MHYKLLEEKLACRASRSYVTLETFSSKDLRTLECCSMRSGKHCLLNCFYDGFWFVLCVALFLPSKLFVSHLLWLQGFLTCGGDGGEIETLLQKSTGHHFCDITKLLCWPKTSFRFSIRSYRTTWMNLLANSIQTGHSSSCQIFGLLLISHSVMSDSLWTHGLQHSRLPCPSLSSGVCSNSHPLNWWCHPIISSSVALFSFCPQTWGNKRKSRFYKLDTEISFVSRLSAEVIKHN